MINDKFKEAIRVIYGRLSNNGFNYAFIGSTNLALQGMDVNPKDLDLVMRSEDLKAVPSLFADYASSAVEELRPDPNDTAWNAKLDKHPAFNVHFKIGGVEVQVLGEANDGEYVSKLLAGKLTSVEIDGLKVPCFTLEAEAQAYEDTYRHEKAKKIRNFLESKG